MYPPALAEPLRRRGHDVAAVAERPELRALPDPDLFEAAQLERRAVVTENIGDFAAIASGYDQLGREHFGVVFIDPTKFPRGNRRTIGRMVRALDRMLGEHPGEGAASLRHWL